MKIYFTLKDILDARSISPRQFSLDTGIRDGTVYDICNNKIERLPVNIIDKISEVLDIEPGDWIKHRKDNAEVDDHLARIIEMLEKQKDPSNVERAYRILNEVFKCKCTD
ncbi:MULTISPECIES: helix-turn-helix transcriptional regulator [unclassified Paenibacillus]|uniref:helix-turn-helix domain-containing protein n=1 Tax=unclassified Paenibacillus TaxID=185978 RepID=UPI00055B1510|nr:MULTISPECIES: helix-turn-helix transcriptional regulator [unclassified Paenibacillus]